MAQIVGDGDTGPDDDTGWQLVEFDFGVPTRRTEQDDFILGGYNNDDQVSDDDRDPLRRQRRVSTYNGTFDPANGR